MNAVDAHYPVARGALAPVRAWWNVSVHYLTPLFVILIVFLAFRLLVASGSSRLAFPLPPELLASPWRLLMPFDFGGSRYRWTPTGYVPIGLLNLVMTVPMIFILILGTLVAISYLLSWSLFRSRVFSATLAICMGFGSQFNYAYVHNGGLLWPLFTLYLFINLYFLYLVATRPETEPGPKIGFVVSLVVFAPCWEQWLDYLVFLLTACGFFYLLCRRDPAWRARYMGRVKLVTLTSVLVACAYLAVKLPYSGEHVTPGHESDTIFTYSSPILSLDDLISNVFTYPYIALTHYCPSWFNGSNSLYHLGAEQILAEQKGYHAEKGELVVMHHQFFWHFYAGAVCLGFAWCFLRTLRSVWTKPSATSILTLVLMWLICTGFAMHASTKFRPYMSVPLLAYKCIISVNAVALLLAYGLMRASHLFADRKKYLLAVLAVWAIVAFSGVDRFPYHAQMGQQAGLGEFPDPARRMKKRLGHLFHSPATD